VRAVLAIARRELEATILSPTGAIVAALFLACTASVWFVLGPQLVGRGFVSGQPASLALFFETALWMLLLLTPAISMRAISEEVRSGTIEILLTAPVRERTIVAGKFLGAMAFLALVLLPTLVLVVAVERHGRPDYGEIAAGYLGLLLLGAALIASGLLASTLTASQVMAFLLTILAWLGLLLLTIGLPILGGLAAAAEAARGAGEAAAPLLELGRAVGAAAAEANPLVRVRTLLGGLLDSFSVAYFAILTAACLVLAGRGLAVRREAG